MDDVLGNTLLLWARNSVPDRRYTVLSDKTFRMRHVRPKPKRTRAERARKKNRRS